MCCICEIQVLHVRNHLHMQNTGDAYAKYVDMRTTGVCVRDMLLFQYMRGTTQGKIPRSDLQFGYASHRRERLLPHMNWSLTLTTQTVKRNCEVFFMSWLGYGIYTFQQAKFHVFLEL